MLLHTSPRIRVSKPQLTDFLDYPKGPLPTKLAQGLEAESTLCTLQDTLGVTVTMSGQM